MKIGKNDGINRVIHIPTSNSLQMERQKQKESPITNIIRSSVEKVGINFPAEKRRVSRQMLTDMNVAQLQIIVNDFHSQIECLNEQLVKFLMDRDDLHMSQGNISLPTKIASSSQNCFILQIQCWWISKI